MAQGFGGWRGNQTWESQPLPGASRRGKAGLTTPVPDPPLTTRPRPGCPAPQGRPPPVGKRCLIVSRSHVVKRSKCFHKWGGGLLLADTDQWFRHAQENSRYRALYLLLISALKKKR